MLSIVQLSRFDAVLRCFSRDSYIRLSQLSSFVNNFFKLFFAVVFVISLSLDSSIRLPYLSFPVNNFFNFFYLFIFLYFPLYFISTVFCGRKNHRIPATVINNISFCFNCQPLFYIFSVFYKPFYKPLLRRLLHLIYLPEHCRDLHNRIILIQ